MTEFSVPPRRRNLRADISRCGTRRVRLLPVMMILTAAVACAAAETAPVQPQPQNAASPAVPPAASPADPSRGRHGMGLFEQGRALLKEKFPDEYASIEQLWLTDRRGAVRKIMELAPRLGFDLPPGIAERISERLAMHAAGGDGADWRQEWGRIIDAVKMKFPSEYAQLAPLWQNEPDRALERLQLLAQNAGVSFPAMPGSDVSGYPSPRDRGRFMEAEAERILRKDSPENFSKLEALRKTDPDAAREYFRKMARDAGLTPEKLLAPEKKTDAGDGAAGSGGKVESVVFTDKELEEQYSQQQSGGQGGNGRGGQFRGPFRSGGFMPPFDRRH